MLYFHTQNGGEPLKNIKTKPKMAKPKTLDRTNGQRGKRTLSKNFWQKRNTNCVMVQFYKKRITTKSYAPYGYSVWRRRQDLNLRWLSPHDLSKIAPSAARTLLLIFYSCRRLAQNLHKCGNFLRELLKTCNYTT